MIFGRVAYLGSLRRKSAVITAGSFTFMYSRPPSISLVTFKLSPSFSTLDANVAFKGDKVNKHNVLLLEASPVNLPPSVLFDLSHRRLPTQILS